MNTFRLPSNGRLLTGGPWFLAPFAAITGHGDAYQDCTLLRVS
jgi:hypothetical protein